MEMQWQWNEGSHSGHFVFCHIFTRRFYWKCGQPIRAKQFWFSVSFQKLENNRISWGHFYFYCCWWWKTKAERYSAAIARIEKFLWLVLKGIFFMEEWRSQDNAKVKENNSLLKLRALSKRFHLLQGKKKKRPQNSPARHVSGQTNPHSTSTGRKIGFTSICAAKSAWLLSRRNAWR